MTTPTSDPLSRTPCTCADGKTTGHAQCPACRAWDDTQRVLLAEGGTMGKPIWLRQWHTEWRDGDPIPARDEEPYQ